MGREESVATVAGTMRELVEQIVDRPEAVAVEIRKQGGEVMLDFRVDPRDVGRVLGSGGRMMKSLRTIACALGRHDGVRFDVNVREA